MAEQSDGLLVREDPAFERRMYLLQRIGWAVMAVVLLAAVLGLFGEGLFSHAAVGPEGGPLRVEYDRFVRHQAPHRLRVRPGPGADRGGKARVWLSAEYLDAVEVERIEPRPDGVELGPDGQTFTFAVDSLEAPATVVFHLVPGRVGMLRGRARLPGGEVLTFTQFVYP